ncbi:MAG: UvrD-helicase domain-containing protein [Proteobacteria bacterium]|nr:UvrD-helicase domain-containing protein [Pseudomonadota bacterium]
MLSDSILDGLNPEQRAAVEATEGPVLVLAGAGSGKTRVLTHRIAHLVGVCGIPPDSILAVTFTNKAAGEMRERVEKLLGSDAQGLWVGTFHSTCVRILRRDIGHLGLSRGFVIYDEADSLGVAKQALKRLSLDPVVHDPKRFRWRIDQWKNRAVMPARAAAEAEDIDTEQSAEVYAVYQRLLADAGALDFGDLLLQTVQLFERFPEVLGYYQRRWQYVLVDEYQDTNRVQYELVTQLAREHGNLCVVGDPDQSVYAWRGADIRNILDFERDYENARVVKLEQNYRSTQPILEGATAMIRHNLGRRDKRMFTQREGGDKIRFLEAANDREEAQFVVSDILAANRRDHRPYGDSAVLYRTNAQSRLFEEELLKYDVPYVVVGGVRFYERAEIKDVLAYLRLLVNPADGQGLRRVVNKPPRGIGKTTIERAEALAEESGGTLLDGLRRFADEGARSAGKVRTFLKLLEELSAELRERPLAEIIGRVLDRTGILRALEVEGTVEAESRIDNLKELLSSAEEFHAANAAELGEDRSELELFLDQVALIADVDNLDQRSDRVSLLTAHSAKGLEFPAVYLVGLEEGIFPHAASASTTEDVEEERRLFYVGMTRAMERLTVTCAAERRRWGTHSHQQPSRFLEEIPDKWLEGERTPAAERARPGSRDGASLDHSYSQEPAGEGNGVRAGTQVRHPVFGVGTVMAVVGDGLNQKLRIRFDRVGVKTVMVRYANLELA